MDLIGQLAERAIHHVLNPQCGTRSAVILHARLPDGLLMIWL